MLNNVRHMVYMGTARCALIGQSGQSPDPISGGAGWIGAGLLGLVLGWLLLKHLPAKDKQLKEMQELHDEQVKGLLDEQSREREKERASRNDLGAVLQKAVADLHRMHVEDMDKDRERFEARIRTQAQEFKDALGLILSHCQKESREVMLTFRTELDRVIGHDDRKPGAHRHKAGDA